MINYIQIISTTSSPFSNSQDLKIVIWSRYWNGVSEGDMQIIWHISEKRLFMTDDFLFSFKFWKTARGFGSDGSALDYANGLSRRTGMSRRNVVEFTKETTLEKIPFSSVHHILPLSCSILFLLPISGIRTYSSPWFRAVVAGRNVYKYKKSTWLHKVVSFHFQSMQEDGIHMCGERQLWNLNVFSLKKRSDCYFWQQYVLSVN